MAVSVSIILILFAGTRKYVDNDYFLYKFFFQYVNQSLNYFKSNFNDLELAIYIIPNFFKFFFYNQNDIVNGSLKLDKIAEDLKLQIGSFLYQ